MLLFQDYWKKIFDAIKTTFPEAGERDLTLDTSGHGDFSFRTFQLMKQENLKPEEIFRRIEQKLGKEQFIQKVVSEGGYINFTVKPSKMLAAISSEIEGTNRYPDIFQDPERVSVEHTSTNPTGPIHIGRIRNSIIGDSLAKLMTRYGYRVTTQYFINDSGKQVATLYSGYRKYLAKENPTIYELLDAYKKASEDVEKDPKALEDVDEIIREYERGDAQTIEHIRMICNVILNGINQSLENIGIRIEDYTWESDLIRTGDVDRVLVELEDDLKEEKGAKYIESLGRNMFLTRSDGTSLYFSRDIAYHLYKLQNFDWLIAVLGENHKEHAKHLEHILRDVMGHQKRIDFVFYSYVSLETGKMATRKGNIVTLDELYERAVEESLKVVREKRPDLPEEKLNSIAKSVAVSAIRFHILKLNPNKQIVFKWSEALNLEGDSAPFVMYSYARASSIMRKLGHSASKIAESYDEHESALIKQMYRYPYVLSEALKGLRPEVVANYLLELTREFNDFYTYCPVINASEDDKQKRVEIIKAYMNIIHDASEIVGIRILEEM